MVQAPLITAPAGSARMLVLLLTLAMFHVSALVAGYAVGNKSSELGPFIVTLTILSFPVTFLTTDLLNEDFGRRWARRVTVLAIGCVALAMLLIEVARRTPVATNSHLPPGAFDHVLAVPAAHIAGLLAGYAFGQFADIGVFHWLGRRHFGRFLWIRVLGSTSAGELVDGLVISSMLVIAPAALLGSVSGAKLLETTWDQAAVRITLAITMIPVVYLLRHMIARSRVPDPEMGGFET